MKTSPKSPDVGKQWPQFLVAFSVNIIAFSMGYHTGWPAPSLPKLLSDDYPHDVTNEEASYITIIGYAGNICGGLLGAALLNKIGRKKTILLIALPQLVSYLLIIMSYQKMELLYVGRTIGGLSEGMCLTIIPLYTAEIAEPGIRGLLSVSLSVTVLLGMLCVNVVGSYVSIRNTAWSFVPFPLIFLLLFWRMPESPYHLVMKNRKEEAEEALRFLKRKKSVNEELSILVEDVNRQMSESGTFRDIFAIDSNRKAFLLVIGARVVQQFTGASAFGIYIQLLLKQATGSLPPHVGSIVLLLVQISMCLSTAFFVDKYGRKPLLLFSTGGCFVNLLLQSVFFALKEYTDVDLGVIDWFPLVMMILFIMLYSSGLGSVVTILSGEFFSTSIKSKAGCLVNVVFAASTMSSTKFYQVTADTFGLTVPFCSFAVVTFLGVLFLRFCVPETKGKSLEEIQQQLKGNKSVIRATE